MAHPKKIRACGLSALTTSFNGISLILELDYARISVERGYRFDGPHYCHCYCSRPGGGVRLKSTAEKVIVDAYSGLKGLIQRKYHHVSLDALEANPKSTARRAVVAEDLEQTEIKADSEVLNQAKSLLDLIRKHAPEAGPAVGVSLEDIEAASLKIQDVIATGAGVQVRGGKFTGPVEIGGIHAGAESSDPSKKK